MGKPLFQIRPAQPADARGIFLMEQACFSAPWSEDGVLSALLQPQTYALLLLTEDGAAGYLIASRLFDEGELLRIAVRPPMRGKGLARALLERMIRENPQVTSWFLDVRAGNLAARGLYESFGFTSLLLRRDYYEKPREDGIMMRWERRS